MNTAPTAESQIGLYNKSTTQAWIFLLIWPWFNILLLSCVLLLLDIFTLTLLAEVIVKIWSGFCAGYLLFNLCESICARFLPAQFLPAWCRHNIWLLRPFSIILLYILIGPIVSLPTSNAVTQVTFLPIVIMLLETLVYIAVMLMLKQQTYHFQSQLQAKQAELQMLKMQSNPHFLFNTLNLIASEVTQDPHKAKALIYDLSDLLRHTVELAKQQFVTLEQELKLVELYLVLQQKRFADRLTFDLDCPGKLDPLPVPSLLLLPIVENAVKYGIAPYARAGHISIIIETTEHDLLIEVQDTGAPFDDTQLSQGEGLRIIRETLNLHYRGAASFRLISCDEGTSAFIQLPR
ncbi:histidine kinase [Pseudoalteromonas sp. McH1-42]|uniref:sensor histidine kinase n=1 Tax=Pseudoalteromonas sp. McH1-42 TaxID=2917752 RepID=UPI001EF54925|nr:histidine kinase [Pseudoalteromonas sp. McH1-42]